MKITLTSFERSMIVDNNTSSMISAAVLLKSVRTHLRKLIAQNLPRKKKGLKFSMYLTDMRKKYFHLVR